MRRFALPGKDLLTTQLEPLLKERELLQFRSG
jgi:hypothetical protein